MRSLLRLVGRPAAPASEEAGGDEWWRGCLLRARAINAALPLKCEPNGAAPPQAEREAARRKKIEDFLSRSPK